MSEERHAGTLDGRVSRRALLHTAALGGAAWLVGCQAPAPTAPAASGRKPEQVERLRRLTGMS
jgi:hypothetical protein